ncbi:MAG: hypothetical protein A2418_03095 [Candidatus Brennerbacteria bacterium RIFOXYC1_FULL_41_11]|uniref:Uncharacterized protein n=1 Tax=Candidatus Brennerbacteria bacterium RIFOXYD1_FULL_41_16 TaxID=1797529 RepID=A0A1G1XKU7_9BACT|nr:MAG: hypothetical protein UU61_C0009G0005 [Parcubacteria group bacterium GW2011_GWB1_41_4]OGY39819.1 MAG: hypothetical protein A2418_03095 [Candidatus Brennerbacteria bacterium RIFOXYC1_FULL_41_11]OGY40582.1 MAG: hypothetical protein A2570_02505 [Candidatus Brennerbacteria bacterium RIFOXYD1_FULL_41_16]
MYRPTERGYIWIVFLVILGVLACALLVGIISLRNSNLASEGVLNEVFEEQLFGVMRKYEITVNEQPYLAFSFCFTDGSQRCIPEGGGLTAVPKNACVKEGEVRICPDSAQPVFDVLSPTRAGAESGEKAKIIFFRGVAVIGSDGFEMQKFKPTDQGKHFNDYDRSRAKPDDFFAGLDFLWKCTIKVFSQGNLEYRDCFEDPYYATGANMRIGTIPGDEAGIVFYVLRSQGIWIYTVRDLDRLNPDPLGQYEGLFSGLVSLYLSDPNTLNPEDLAAIGQWLSQANLTLPPETLDTTTP